MSFNTPTYSPIGVRLPPSMKTSLFTATTPLFNSAGYENLEG
jgi:hypothetical protein